VHGGVRRSALNWQAARGKLVKNAASHVAHGRERNRARDGSGSHGQAMRERLREVFLQELSPLPNSKAVLLVNDD
jgi:hypothetical protein